MIFVFCTIVEFAVVLNLNQAMKYTERLRKQNFDVSDHNKFSTGKVSAIEYHMEEIRHATKQHRSSNWRRLKLFDNSMDDENCKKVIFWKHGFTNKIDFISFLAFLFCYCMFNIIYAIKYTK